MIPILINNRDLLDCTRRAVEFFLRIPDTLIVLVDQASTYPPLLEWYRDECPIRVHRLDENRGPRGGQATLYDVLRRLPKPAHYWFAAEPDLDYSELPRTFLDDLARGLTLFPHVQGAGLSLRLDDLPRTNGSFDNFRQHIYNTESRNWIGSDLPIPEISRPANYEEIRQFHEQYPDWYLAGTDTAGVMHRINWNGDYSGVRSAKHIVRHLPWYHDEGKRPPDFEYYLQHADPRGTHYTALIHTYRKESHG